MGRTGTSSGAYFIRTVVEVQPNQRVLWESSLETIAEARKGYVCVSLGRDSILGGKSGEDTPEERDWSRESIPSKVFIFDVN